MIGRESEGEGEEREAEVARTEGDICSRNSSVVVGREYVSQ